MGVSIKSCSHSTIATTIFLSCHHGWAHNIIGANCIFPILYWIRLIKRISWISTRATQVWMKAIKNFSVSPTESWLFGVIFLMYGFWSSVGWKFKPHKKSIFQNNWQEIKFCELEVFLLLRTLLFWLLHVPATRMMMSFLQHHITSHRYGCLATLFLL